MKIKEHFMDVNLTPYGLMVSIDSLGDIEEAIDAQQEAYEFRVDSLVREGMTRVEAEAATKAEGY